jgi:TonB family protein
MMDTAAAQATDIDMSSLLQGWDRQQDELRVAVWRSYSTTAALGEDSRGRTVRDDLNDWVMTKDTQDRLLSIRATAERQLRSGNEQAAKETLQSAGALIKDQQRVLSLVNSYWRQRIVLNRQRDLWMKVLDLSTDADAAQSRVWIDPLEAALVRDLSPASKQATLTARVEQLKQAYDGERINLAKIVSDRRLAEGKVMEIAERHPPCPPSRTVHVARARDDAGALMERPVSITTDMSVDRFYPQDARLNGISGSIELRLTIDSSGCMERAEVVLSSGANELDDAAINLSQLTKYLPALHAGQPVRAVYLRTIAFKSDGARTDPQDSGGAPTTATGYVNQGNKYLDRGEYDLAVVDYDKAIESNPHSAIAFADRGMARIWQRKYDLARADFDAAERLDASNAVVFRGRGLLALNAGDLDGALSAFTASLSIQPRSTFTLQQRAQTYLRSGERDKALADYARTIQVQPNSFLAYSWRAGIFRTQERLDLSLAEAGAVIAANPNEARAYSTAGAIYAASGQDGDAIAAFNRAVEISANEANYLMRAGFLRRTDPHGARADIDALLKLNPTSIGGSMFLAEIQSDGQDYAGAVVTLDSAITTHAGNGELLTARGIVYAKSGQAALAENDFTAARALATTASALNSICWSKATAGVALESALTDCDAALAAEPARGAIIDSRGFVLLRLGRCDEAVTTYNAALEIQPLSASSLFGRGLAKQCQADKHDANVDFRAAQLADAHIARTFADYGLLPK